VPFLISATQPWAWDVRSERPSEEAAGATSLRNRNEYFLFFVILHLCLLIIKWVGQITFHKMTLVLFKIVFQLSIHTIYNRSNDF
jgi:hypothetical protein